MVLATHTSSAGKGSVGAFFDALATFYHRRWLLRYFIQRQVTRSYRRSYLGFLWAFLGPLIWVIFLSLIFSKMIGIRYRVVEGDPTLNFGLYLYCGLLPFLAFSESLNKGINSIKGNSGLVEKVVFPLELLPFTNVVTSLIDKLFSLGALLLILLVLEHRWHWTVVLLPLVMVVQMLFILGMSYLMAIVGTYVPDVAEVMRPIIRGMFFATPIIWPAGRLPESLAWIVDYNPLAYLVESYRALILYGELPGLMSTVNFSLFAVAVFVVGFALFIRLKPGFADQI